MRFKIFLFVPLLCLTNHLFANPVFDSVGVENQNGKKVVLHKIEAKETYFAVGRRYNVKPNLIIQFNNNAVLHPGMTIKVPTDLPFESAQRSTPQTAQTTAPTSTQQYKVSQHETLYGIAKRFGLTVDEVKRQNNLTRDVLTPGEVLNITTGGNSTSNKAPETTTPKVAENKPVQVQQQTPPPAPQPVKPEPQPQQAQQQTQQPVDTRSTQQYKVSAGETLYSIAKRFGTTVEDVTSLNKLTSPTLAPGQILLVRSGTPPPPAPVQQQTAIARRDSTNVAAIDSLTNERNIPANRYGLFMKNEKGPAIWMDDSSFDPNKKLVLHRTAPIGTVIKITNPMTNRTTFAKVVGTFTDNENTKDVVLVVTKNVADALGVLDKRFRVTISYGVPANEQ